MAFKKGKLPWNKGKPFSEEVRAKMKQNYRYHINSGTFKEGQAPLNKGKHPSEESRRKMSEGQKRRMSNPEERRKISEAQKGKHFYPKNEFKKGNIPWNKNKIGIFSEETRRKIGLASKGKHQSEETIQKRIISLTGKTRSEEIRKKMSLAQKGKHFSEEARRNMSKSHLGKKLSEETKMKLRGKIPWSKGKHGVFSPERLKIMSEMSKKRWENPEFRKRQVESHKGRHPSEETIQKRREKMIGHPYWGKGFISEETKRRISLATKGRHHSEETKRKLSETRKRLHLAPTNAFQKGHVVTDEMRLKMRENTLKMYASGKFPLQTNTLPERLIKNELITRGYREGIDFIHQFNFYGKFMCDFVFPQQRVVIECDGDYWHMKPNSRYSKGAPNEAQRRTLRLDRSKEGYICKVDNGSWTLLRFWESDIKKEVSKCVDEIEKALKKKV